MQARKASMILVGIGAYNVIASKSDPDTDIVMLTLLLQRMVELGGTLIDVVHTVSDFEREALDVQKMLRILHIDQEDKSQPRHPDETWPSKGAVEIKDVKLKYDKKSELVLKGLNVTIKAGEKVGVVGRTGAGKSTLANALTRIVEICGGSIKFDGVDISKVSLD
jgi:ABC-type multidrug transport system fused ATPase/permease subunit